MDGYNMWRANNSCLKYHDCCISDNIPRNMKNTDFLYQNREVCDWEYIEKIEFQGKTEAQINFTFKMICFLGFALASMAASGLLFLLYLLIK